jgi:DNA-binding transcriptional LysR family regulator
MNIHQLRYFVTVAEHLNFTNAAKQLYIGQPALSRQIAELEKDIGVMLLERNNRSVTLTAAGIVLLKNSKTILSLYAEVIDMTRKAGRGLIGSLSIGYLYDKNFLPELIGRFREKYVDTVVNVHRHSWGSLIKSLLHGDIDFAFTYSFGLEKHPEIEYHAVYADELMVVLPERHPLSARSKICLSDLAGEPFIHVSRDDSPLAYEMTYQICQKNGFIPHVVHETPHVESLLMLVEAGIGISILAHHPSSHVNPALRFIEIEGENTNLNIGIAWSKKNKNPAIKLFLQEMTEHTN